MSCFCCHPKPVLYKVDAMVCFCKSRYFRLSYSRVTQSECWELNRSEHLSAVSGQMSRKSKFKIRHEAAREPELIQVQWHHRSFAVPLNRNISVLFAGKEAAFCFRWVQQPVCTHHSVAQICIGRFHCGGKITSLTGIIFRVESFLSFLENTNNSLTPQHVL